MEENNRLRSNLMSYEQYDPLSNNFIQWQSP